MIENVFCLQKITSGSLNNTYDLLPFSHLHCKHLFKETLRCKGYIHVLLRMELVRLGKREMSKRFKGALNLTLHRISGVFFSRVTDLQKLGKCETFLMCICHFLAI